MTEWCGCGSSTEKWWAEECGEPRILREWGGGGCMWSRGDGRDGRGGAMGVVEVMRDKDRGVTGKQRKMKELWARDTRGGRWGEGRGLSNGFYMIFLKNNFI